MAWNEIKTKIRILYESFIYGFDKGLRYYRDGRYRRQVKTNLRNRHKYGSFIGNKTSLREALIRRDGQKCSWCSSYLHRSEMTIDHIKPVSAGGENKKNNLQIMCVDCHIAKTNSENGGCNEYVSSFENKPFKEAFNKLKNATQTTSKH